MKINSSTHKIIVVPKSYLFLSENPLEEYELLPEKYWLKFLVPIDFEIFDLNFMWLLERWYLINPPDCYKIGIPTLAEENLRTMVVCDPELWMCKCNTNPLHIKKTGICSDCGWSNEIIDYSDAFSYLTPEKLWGNVEKNVNFDGVDFCHNGVKITPNYIMDKNKYSKNREIIYRLPPMSFWEVILHTIRGTIFSWRKPITKKEVEEHGRKLLGI